jgi:hypothetical protein
MRSAILVVLALVVGAATPAVASMHRTLLDQAWNDCHDLAWIRGVHVELGELPNFMDQCIAGQVEFGEDFAKYYGRLPN